jgi:hypothetical protein
MVRNKPKADEALCVVRFWIGDLQNNRNPAENAQSYSRPAGSAPAPFAGV